MKYKYISSESKVLSDAQAPIVGRELARIEKHNGAITPEAVVDAARNTSSPLHAYFTWDNTKAAEKYRLHEARLIVAAVVIIPIVKADQEARSVRAFISVSGAKNEKRFKGRGYISTISAMSNKEYKQQVLRDALAELATFKRKYEHLLELSNVIEAIKNLELAP